MRDTNGAAASQQEQREYSDEKTERTISGFVDIYANWLVVRGAKLKLPESSSLEEYGSLCSLEEELARRIATTPLRFPTLLGIKFEVLEFYMGRDGGSGNWNDKLEIVLLAGLKADVLRLCGS